MSQILNLDERGVEFGTDHHTQSDEVEKEKRDHDPGQTAVSRVIAEQAGQQRRKRQSDPDPPQGGEQRARPFRAFLLPAIFGGGERIEEQVDGEEQSGARHDSRQERKSVGQGKGGSVRVGLGGRRSTKKK